MTIEAHPTRANSFLHQIAQTLMEGVALVNRRGRLVYANGALEQLLGYEPGELVGLPWTSLFPEEQHNWAEVWQVTEGDGAASRYEMPVLCKDGSTIPALVSSCLFSDGGHDRGVLSTFTDLRERYDLQARVQQLEELAMVGQNLSCVVHELNNSLTILSLQARLLSVERSVNPKLDENLAIIQDQTKRMLAMVDDLRSSTVPHQPFFETIDVNALIQQTLDLQREQLRTEGIEVIVDLDADLPLTQADPYKLQQVFVNIINNASQAMTGSRSTGKLSIATALLPAGKDKALRIQIRFTDSGPGIPPDVMPRIFEPFFTTKDVKDGMGLGLAICEQIMERHGGCIQAENNPGGGASFSLELPVIGQRSIHRSPSPDQRRSRHTERATHSSTSTKHHVLIVDDEPSVLESLKQALEGAGYQVTAVADARQALAMLDRNRVDLIISDVTMSQMSGQQFWQALKDHHPQLARRTIFATGDSSSQERRALLQDWGCAYIEKPFRLDEVLCLIRSTLLDE